MSSASKLVSRVAVNRYPVFCVLVSMGSIVRIRMRVPAGTVTLSCAGPAALAERARRPPVQKLPFGNAGEATAIAMVTRRAAGQKRELRISESSFDLGTLPDDGQRRVDL